MRFAALYLCGAKQPRKLLVQMVEKMEGGSEKKGIKGVAKGVEYRKRKAWVV